MTVLAVVVAAFAQGGVGPWSYAEASTDIGGIARSTSSPATSSQVASPSPDYVIVTAASLDATDLVYTGTFEVPIGETGTITILRFTLTQGSFTDASISLPCRNARSLTTGSGNASTTDATFDVVSLVGTVGGTPIAYTAATPPTGPLPAAVTIDNLQLSAVTLTAATLTTPSYLATTTPC